jgi:hypothetical protein
MRIYMTVSEAAQELGEQLGVEVNPRLISDLLYQRKLEIRNCQIVGGHRLIPRDYLPAILEVLQERGLAMTSRPEDHATANRPPEGGPDLAD